MSFRFKHVSFNFKMIWIMFHNNALVIILFKLQQLEYLIILNIWKGAPSVFIKIYISLLNLYMLLLG